MLAWSKWMQLGNSGDDRMGWQVQQRQSKTSEAGSSSGRPALTRFWPLFGVFWPDFYHDKPLSGSGYSLKLLFFYLAGVGMMGWCTIYEQLANSGTSGGQIGHFSGINSWSLASVAASLGEIHSFWWRFPNLIPNPSISPVFWWYDSQYLYTSVDTSTCIKQHLNG